VPDSIDLPRYGLSYLEERIGYREWARWNDRLGDIHSVDDRFDHDIYELMA
jgi:hypothetical protein